MLFPSAPRQHRSTGVLPYQTIRALVRSHEIAAVPDIQESQIQPASIDLRLGSVAYRVQASFLPGPGRTVDEKIAELSLHAVDLSNGGLLEKGCVYVVPLLERVSLSNGISGVANPKSSTGRLDLFTRLITDGAVDFEVVPAGYTGPLYAEIFPRAFSILARQGSRLNQLRFRRGSTTVGKSEMRDKISRREFVDRDLTELEAKTLDRGIPLTVDLEGVNGGGIVGYRAKPHTPLIDVDKINEYEPTEYWDPLIRSRSRSIILNPDDFYILASKEAVSVPMDHAAEMVPYDAFTGEFRAHYAGFFDPGFGHAEVGASGTRAVLEVRSHGVPFIIEDGQLVGRLKYERLTDVPDQLYGAESGSSYQRQGLALSKHFREWPDRFL